MSYNAVVCLGYFRLIGAEKDIALMLNIVDPGRGGGKLGSLDDLKKRRSRFQITVHLVPQSRRQLLGQRGSSRPLQQADHLVALGAIHKEESLLAKTEAHVNSVC